jgi:hypothetical protein
MKNIIINNNNNNNNKNKNRTTNTHSAPHSFVSTQQSIHEYFFEVHISNCGRGNV